MDEIIKAPLPPWLRNTSGWIETGSCPLCENEHAVCRFAAGTLYCVEPDCANPHHRKPVKADG
jgi:hypothetical protein